MRSKKYIISAVAVLVMGAMLFCGCSKGNDFEMSKGKYVDKNSGVAYSAAPACYEPIAIGDEVFGTLEKTEFYQISGAATDKWLCEPNGTIFYADGVSLPTLGEMNVSYADVVLEDTVLVKITDSSVISAIADAYESGEAVMRPMVASDAYEINWRIKMADESLGIYYILSYIEISEDYVIEGENGKEINLGRKFIFNRFDDNRCVAAGDVMDKYAAEFRELSENAE